MNNVFSATNRGYQISLQMKRVEGNIIEVRVEWFWSDPLQLFKYSNIQIQVFRFQIFKLLKSKFVFSSEW